MNQKQIKNLSSIKKKMGISPSTILHPNYLLIGIPTRNLVSCHFMASVLAQDKPINTSINYSFISGKKVDQARNLLVKEALKIKAKYLLFLDDDLIIPPNTINKLLTLAQKGYDVVSGVYYSKQVPPQPLIFKGRGNGSFKKWKTGDILTDIDGIGMGLVIINTKIFKKIPQPWFKTIESKRVSKDTLIHVDESLYFCDKLIKNNVKIIADTSIQAIHHDVDKDAYYFNDNNQPLVIQNNKVIYPQ